MLQVHPAAWSWLRGKHLPSGHRGLWLCPQNWRTGTAPAEGQTWASRTARRSQIPRAEREKKFIRPVDVRSSASQGLLFLIYRWENRHPMRWWPWPRALSSQAVVRLWTLLCLMPEIWLFPWSQLPLAEEPESHPWPLLPKPARPRGSLASSY